MPEEPQASRASPRAHQLALLVDSVLDYAIFLLDTEGRIVTWNRGAERLKGYTAEDIIGRPFSVFYTEEDRLRDHPAAELEIAAREGRYEEEGWRVRKDGSRFWANVTITAIRDATGELVGFGKVTRDLTARRLSEELLRSGAADLQSANRQLAQFTRFVSAVRDYAIFMLDPGGHITTWNAGAEHIKGYTAAEAIGRSFTMFYTEEDRARNHPANELEIAAREGRYEEEGWRVRKDGSRFWASVTITAVRDDQGFLSGFAKVTRDLTARREYEDRLRAAYDQLERANADLQRFAAVAAHDLREPLLTAAGFVRLVVDGDGDRLSEDGQRHLEHVSASLHRMQRLIEDLLAYARAGAADGGLHAVNLAAAIPPVLHGLGAAIAERRATIEVDVPDDASVLAEPSGVHVLLQNLISNAIKYGDPERPAVVVEARSDDGGWLISVVDNGEGIGPDDQARIFAAFERLPDAGPMPGTGLGLSICKRVVDRAGGEIGVDSEPGRGSRFWVRLRAAET